METKTTKEKTETTAPCHQCGGTGKFRTARFQYHYRTCSYCDGTGKMKYKPEVPNEVICENVLSVNSEGVGQNVRVVLQYDDMLKMEVHEPTSPEFKNILLLFTKEDVEAIIKLYEEWKD